MKTVIGKARGGLFPLLLLGVALAGCGTDGSPGAAADNEIDPAIASALDDAIMVDPDLVQQDRRFAVRGDGPRLQAPVPAGGTGGPALAGEDGLLRAPPPSNLPGKAGVTLAQLAAEQARRTPRAPGSSPACNRTFRHDMAWANRLPAAFPLYADAQLLEAAGNDDARCGVRLVSFTSRTRMQTLIDFYYTRAIRNGFNAEHQLIDGEHVLAGARTKDGAAYYLVFADAKDGTTSVDMIVNKGR